MSDAAHLVLSDIHHTRHGDKRTNAPKHFLARRGLSVLIDLDRLDEAGRQSAFFSVNRFNLVSFSERDFGPNYRKPKSHKPIALADYARQIAHGYAPDIKIQQIQLLAFPRILGIIFNPISVFLCRDLAGDIRVIIYEVHNTFGDAHSYVALPDKTGHASLHRCDKKLHVSPFFGMDGFYDLFFKEKAAELRLIVKYWLAPNKPALTATMRGTRTSLSSIDVLKMLWQAGQFPSRPLLSIHVEALKLWWKRLRFHPRPDPLTPAHSKATKRETRHVK